MRVIVLLIALCPIASAAEFQLATGDKLDAEFNRFEGVNVVLTVPDGEVTLPTLRFTGEALGKMARLAIGEEYEREKALFYEQKGRAKREKDAVKAAERARVEGVQREIAELQKTIDDESLPFNKRAAAARRKATLKKGLTATEREPEPKQRDDAPLFFPSKADWLSTHHLNMLTGPQTGSFGRLTRGCYRVAGGPEQRIGVFCLQVLANRQMLVMSHGSRHRSSPVYLLDGIDTSEITDGAKCDLPQTFFIVGHYEYLSTGGSQKRVLRLVPVE